MEKLLSVSDVSKVLKISKNDVYTLLNSGHIPYLKLGSKKVRESDLDSFISSLVGKDVIIGTKGVRIEDIV